jgi:hypothetical protein
MTETNGYREDEPDGADQEEHEVSKVQLLLNIEHIKTASTPYIDSPPRGFGEDKVASLKRYMESLDRITSVLFEGHEKNYSDVGVLISQIRTKVEALGVVIKD